MLTDMYINRGAPKKPVSNEIAINISSDESDDDADMAQKISERSEKGEGGGCFTFNFCFAIYVLTQIFD